MTDVNQNAEKNDFSDTGLWRSRLKLIAIFSLFVGPLLVAFFWYYGLGTILLPQGRSNYAPLITPPITLTAFENSRFDRGSISLGALKHKWTIVHLIDSQCDEQCEKALYNTRQTRLALGKDANRIQRYVVINNAVLANKIQRHHADAVLLKQSEQGMDKPGIYKQLQPIIEQYNMGNHDALLIDPLGNVMMMIPLALSPRLLLKDLKKLLKVSRIG